MSIERASLFGNSLNMHEAAKDCSKYRTRKPVCSFTRVKFMVDEETAADLKDEVQ